MPNGQQVTFHGEFYLESRKREPIHAACLVLIARSGVLCEYVQQRLTAFLRQLVEQLRRTLNPHRVGRERKTAACLRMRIRVRKVRLDVENRRAVHQIRARDMQHRAVRRGELHPVKPH